MRHGIQPPNVWRDRWRELHEWRAWEPPLNCIRGEQSYRENLVVIFSGLERPFLAPLPVRLVRDRENAYDANAVAAHVEGLQVGFLARELAAVVGPAMDAVICYWFEVCGVARVGPSTRHHIGVHLWMGRRLTDAPVYPVPTKDDGKRYEVPWPP